MAITWHPLGVCWDTFLRARSEDTCILARVKSDSLARGPLLLQRAQANQEILASQAVNEVLKKKACSGLIYLSNRNSTLAFFVRFYFV